jgi:hypothetical protein
VCFALMLQGQEGEATVAYKVGLIGRLGYSGDGGSGSGHVWMWDLDFAATRPSPAQRPRDAYSEKCKKAWERIERVLF